MNIFSFIYHEVLFRPLFNLLVGITNLLPSHSVGLAIILVTLIVRLLLLPSSIHQARHLSANQKKMTGLREELKKINELYKKDSNKRAAATLELYRKAGINPVAGFLPLLVQLPILLALYRVFLVGIGPDTWPHLYSFVAAPAAVQMTWFGLNLGTPSLLLGVATGICQFVQMRLMTPSTTSPAAQDDTSAHMMASMQKNMTYIFPAMTVFIAWRVPAALSLYWMASTLLALCQQYVVKRLMRVDSVTPMM